MQCPAGHLLPAHSFVPNLSAKGCHSAPLRAGGGRRSGEPLLLSYSVKTTFVLETILLEVEVNKTDAGKCLQYSSTDSRLSTAVHTNCYIPL